MPTRQTHSAIKVYQPKKRIVDGERRTTDDELRHRPLDHSPPPMLARVAPLHYPKLGVAGAPLTILMSLIVAMLRTNRFTRTMAGPSGAMDNNVTFRSYVHQANTDGILLRARLTYMYLHDKQLRVSPVPLTPDGRILASYRPGPRIWSSTSFSFSRKFTLTLVHLHTCSSI